MHQLSLKPKIYILAQNNFFMLAILFFCYISPLAQAAGNGSTVLHSDSSAQGNM
jgi:hypothetical protein